MAHQPTNQDFAAAMAFGMFMCFIVVPGVILFIRALERRQGEKKRTETSDE